MVRHHKLYYILFFAEDKHKIKKHRKISSGTCAFRTLTRNTNRGRRQGYDDKKKRILRVCGLSIDKTNNVSYYGNTHGQKTKCEILY